MPAKKHPLLISNYIRKQLGYVSDCALPPPQSDLNMIGRFDCFDYVSSAP